MIAFMEGNVIAVVLVPNNIKIKIEHENHSLFSTFFISSCVSILFLTSSGVSDLVSISTSFFSKYDVRLSNHLLLAQ